MLSFLKQLSFGRRAWFLLALSAFLFELCALFFQHQMHLAPCVMCIYERVAMFGVLAAGLLGFIAPKIAIIRWSALTLWLVSAGWGLQLAIEHVSYQFPDPNELFGATCDIFVSFPSWLPLNTWVPWLFEASGSCSDIVWQFLTLSMPQWLIVIFSGLLLTAIAVTITQFSLRKN